MYISVPSKALNPTFMATFILINLIIQQIFDFPDEHQKSDTGIERYIYNSNTAQNPWNYSY